MRTPQYRYTIWMNDFTSAQSFDPGKVYAEEMYDYTSDPLERVNIYGDEKYKEAAADMHKKMIEFFHSQAKTH